MWNTNSTCERIVRKVHTHVVTQCEICQIWNCLIIYVADFDHSVPKFPVIWYLTFQSPPSIAVAHTLYISHLPAGITCICRNYMLQFHTKMKGFFLFAEVNFAFWDRIVPCTPTYMYDTNGRYRHVITYAHTIWDYVTMETMKIDSCVRGRHIYMYKA